MNKHYSFSWKFDFNTFQKDFDKNFHSETWETFSLIH